VPIRRDSYLTELLDTPVLHLMWPTGGEKRAAFGWPFPRDAAGESLYNWG
jgi:hypothetical protein